MLGGAVLPSLFFAGAEKTDRSSKPNSRHLATKAAGINRGVVGYVCLCTCVCVSVCLSVCLSVASLYQELLSPVCPRRQARRMLSW